MIRWRWLVIAVWIVIVVASLAAASGLGDLLTNRFTLPGTDTRRAEQILEDRFGSGLPDRSSWSPGRGAATSPRSCRRSRRRRGGRPTPSRPARSSM